MMSAASAVAARNGDLRDIAKLACANSD